MDEIITQAEELKKAILKKAALDKNYTNAARLMSGVIGNLKKSNI